MTKQFFSSVTLLTAVLAGCAPEDVPNNPSWDQDVYPIIQGSCGHCHGATVRQVPGSATSRFDVCSSEAMAAAGIPLPVTGSLFGAATAGPLLWISQIVPAKGKTRPLMPPPPAAPLSDYEREVLLKWVKRAGAITPAAGQPHPSCAKQTRNREPKAVLVSQAVNEENELVVTVDTSDPDGDQVLGKVTVGGADKPILSTGRYAHVFPGATMGSPVKVTLHDGYVASPVVVDF